VKREIVTRWLSGLPAVTNSVIGAHPGIFKEGDFDKVIKHKWPVLLL